jgi:hypothetical protein
MFCMKNSIESRQLCNLGHFLHAARGDGAAAASMYKRALALAPNHPNTLCNYAVGGDGRARAGSARLPALKFKFV